MSSVLIIESEAEVAQSLEQNFKDKGAIPILTEDGAEALKIARDKTPDLIVLCVELPRGSGYSVCNKLKKDSDLSSIPLILTSKQATEETFEQHKKLRTRAEEYVKKPYSVPDLLKLASKYIDIKVAEKDSSAANAPEVEVSLDDIAIESGGVFDEEEVTTEGGEGLTIDESELPVIASAAAQVTKKSTSATTNRSAKTPVATAGERSEIRQLRQKIQKLENTLQEKELEFNDRLLEESSRGRDAVELKKKLANIEREFEKYKQESEGAKNEAKNAKRDLDRIKEEIKSSESEQGVLSEKIGQLVDKVKQLAAERDELKEKLEQSKSQNKDVSGEIQGMEKVKEKAKKAVSIAIQLLDETGMTH